MIGGPFNYPSLEDEHDAAAAHLHTQLQRQKKLEKQEPFADQTRAHRSGVMGKIKKETKVKQKAS